MVEVALQQVRDPLQGALTFLEQIAPQQEMNPEAEGRQGQEPCRQEDDQ